MRNVLVLDKNVNSSWKCHPENRMRISKTWVILFNVLCSFKKYDFENFGIQGGLTSFFSNPDLKFFPIIQLPKHVKVKRYTKFQKTYWEDHYLLPWKNWVKWIKYSVFLLLITLDQSTMGILELPQRPLFLVNVCPFPNKIPCMVKIYVINSTVNMPLQ